MPLRRFRPVPKAATAVRVAADGSDPYRLPSAVVPTHYTVSLSVNLTDFTFGGSVHIDLNVLADTDTIVLHAASSLTFTSDSVTVQPRNQTSQSQAKDGDVIVVTKVVRSNEYQTVTITLDKALKKNLHYTLGFAEFTSPLSNDLSGFYLSSYETKEGETRYLATTQFESTSARKAFPCFDEPSFKARFDIAISHDKNIGVRSNMLQSAETPGADDNTTFTTTFTTTVPMPTYLLAWVVSDFEKLSNEDGTFNTWARKDIVQGGTLSQEVGPKALAELGQYTGIPYELPKMDQFAIPDFDAGAMENWGLVTYREEYLIQTESTDVRYEQQIATVICHELGHQWTGDLVTLDWWSNTWLNEGFATFFENFICDKIKPDMKLIEKSITTYAMVGMTNDLLENQHAMSSPVSSPEEIEGKFDRISYSKGGTVLRMFQHVLTPAVFQKGLARYLANNEYQNGTPDKLFRAFNAEAAAENQVTPNAVSLPENVNFATVAKTWTEQVGVPVVTVTCDFSAKKCTLKQEQMRATPSATPGRNKWYIPVTLVTSKSASVSTKTVAWLTPTMESLVVNIDIGDDAEQKEWVVFNPQQTGYYRVQYDETSRKRVMAALQDPKNAELLDAATRAQVLCDFLGLANSELLDMTQTIAVLQILKDSQDSAVWLAGYRVIGNLVNLLANTDVYSSFKIIMKQITEDSFSKLGLKVKDEDDHNTRHARYYVAPYACESGNADCLGEAADLLSDLLDNHVPIHVDMARTVLCYGVKASNATVFGKVKDMWQAANGATRNEIASALACSADKGLVTGLLTDLLSKKKATTLDRDDLRSLLRTLIMQQPDHRRLVLDFLKNDWKTMDTFFGESTSLASILSLLIDTVRTDAEYREVETWVAGEFAGRAEYGSIKDSLEGANSRLGAWFRKHYDDVAKYIYEQTGTTPPATTPGTPPTTTPGLPTKAPTNSPPNSSTNPPPPATTPSGASFVKASAATMLALVLLVAALAQRA